MDSGDRQCTNGDEGPQTVVTFARGLFIPDCPGPSSMNHPLDLHCESTSQGARNHTLRPRLDAHLCLIAILCVLMAGISFRHGIKVIGHLTDSDLGEVPRLVREEIAQRERFHPIRCTPIGILQKCQRRQ